MIFVDTGAFFAWAVPTDPDHTAAITWLDSNTMELITTDYVVDELLTLLLRRREPERAKRIGDALFSERICTIHWTSPQTVIAAWRVFQEFADKRWSFTDCVSRVVMQQLNVSTAFAFDDHFRQFGTVLVVPSP